MLARLLWFIIFVSGDSSRIQELQNMLETQSKFASNLYWLATIAIGAITCITLLIVVFSAIRIFISRGRKLKEIENKMEEKVIALRKETKNMKNDITKLTADGCRLFALAAYDNNLFDASALWWTRDICECAKIEIDKDSADEMIRLAIDNILKVALPKCTHIDKETLTEIKTNLECIPPILKKEKEEIEKILKKLEEGGK